MNNNYKEQAIPLIIYNQESQFYDITDEAVNFLKNVPAPIGVITVAGLYRTGKSYLLNRMLLNKQSGFGVGPTVNACTKGLWVWGTPLKGQTPEGDMLNIIIIDSEGIGSLCEDQTHDSRIFSLAVLLGSCFIYNSVGSIDENAIQNLSLVVNLTKHIHITSNNDEVDCEDYSPYFPSFFWIIRDFSLQLVDQDNEPITPREYLEKSLLPQNGFSDEVEQKNRIRRLLTSFFKERDCITMVRPIVNEDNLQKLDQMDLDQLRPEFFEQVMNLRKRILTQCKPKTLNGKLLNGDMFVLLAKSYLTSINEGSVPNIENAWSYLCKNECGKAEQLAFEYYEKQVKENIYPRIPTTTEEIKNLNKQIKQNVYELFRKKCVGEVSETFLQSLKKSIRSKFLVTQQYNEKESYNQCQAFIQREFNPIERKLKLNEYNSFSEYEKDLQLFHSFLIDHGPKGHNRKYLFSDFIKQALSEGANYFVNRISAELDNQSSYAQDLLNQTQQELKEVKEESQKDRQNMLKKIQDLERYKLEAQNNLQKNTDLINELNKQKLLIEQELVQNHQKEKQELNFQLNQLKSKLLDVEDQLKNSERENVLSASNFRKEKALLEHKTQHFEKLLEEYTHKEKQFDSSISNTKSELSSQIKDLQSKHDKVVKELQQQILETQEKNQEITEKYEEKIKGLENQNEQLIKLKEKNTNLLQQSQTQVNNLKKDIMKLQLSEKQNSTSLRQDMSDKIQTLQNDNDVLQGKLKQVSETLKVTIQESKRNEALNQQKINFIQSQFEDSKQQLADLKKLHDSTLDAFEVKENSGKAENKQLIIMKENHIHEIKQLESESQQQKNELHKYIDQLLKDREEIELSHKMQIASLTNQISELEDDHQQNIKERNKILQQVQEAEEYSKLSFKEIESKNQQKITDLEEQLQNLKDSMQSEHIELQCKSEESMTQLRNFYELEKERLENRLIDERDKNTKNYNTLVEEYENRIREEQRQYEDEIESLKDELQQYEMQIANISAQYEHDLDIKIKNQESLEKMYKETKDQLSLLQNSFNTQMEQQITQLQSERKQLNDKIDILIIDLQKKDKDFTTTLQKKEQLESTLMRKEEQWNMQKMELLQEKNSLSDKLEESKKLHLDVQNELLENKINYEKSIALSSQQNEFFSKKVEELEKQMELSSSRYEERIKQQKLEWMQELNEKLGSKQEDKMTIEIKYENLKKQLKEIQLNNSKEITQLEKEKAVALEKLSNLEIKQKDYEEKYLNDNSALTKNLQLIKDSMQQLKFQLQLEIDDGKKKINQLETEKHDIQSSYERDKALWEGKQLFLESQKDQLKQDIQENQRKFEQTLQHLNSKRQADQKEHEQNVSERLVQLEKKYQQQIKELNDTQQTKIQEALDKQKKYEKELKNQNDRVLLDQQTKSSTQLYTEKRLNEMIENEKRYQQEIDKLKSEREQKNIEIQKTIDKLKDSNKLKINELEEKCREGDKKRSTLIFEHEKERAKWSLEKDHLLQQKNDIQDNINKLEKKLEVLTRDNERLKTDRGLKRSQGPNLGSSFQLSRNTSSDKKSPPETTTNLNLFNRYSSNNNENSLMNNTTDRSGNSGFNNSQEEISKEGVNKVNILQDLKEDEPVNNVGFKFFYQRSQQDKTPDRRTSNRGLYQQ